MSERTGPQLRWLIDLGAIAALLLVGVVAWAPPFLGGRAWLAGVGAAVLGIGIAALAAWLRWGVLNTAAAVVVGYFAFGGALALREQTVFGVFPSLDTLRELALGAVFAWKQLLTSQAPLPGEDALVVLPFLTTLIAAVVGASLALRLRRGYPWAVVAPAALLIVAIAFGMPQPAAPLAQGAVFLGVSVAWLAYRGALLRSSRRGAVAQSQSDSGGEGALGRGAATRRLGLAAAVIVVALAAGGTASAVVASASPRYVLRDVVIPPFDVREYPSPLQSFRAYVRDAKDKVLFTVDGLPEGARVRLATMDAYDGVVYNVSGGGAGASGSFVRVGERIAPSVEGTKATLDVTVGELGGVWLPDAGYPTRMAFEGARGEALARTLHYNSASGVAVVTAGLEEGDQYQLETVIPHAPSDTALADAGFASIDMPKQVGIPLTAASVGGDLTADADTPIAQARALEGALSTAGFFSHGLEGEPRSRAGHGSERLDALLGEEQMVGDDEQYATAMAIMASQLGMPARVVMGFYPEAQSGGGTFAATGDTLHVWVEVAFAGLGWVTFDPTPPDDQVPTDEDTKPRTDPKPQVIQPPPPPQEPVQLPPEIPADDGENDDEASEASWLGTVLWIAGGSAALLLVLAAPFIAILALKLGRRRRRRASPSNADRISGGWDEFVDRAVDFGADVPAKGTRRAGASAVDSHFAAEEGARAAGAVLLAERADSEVFGPGDPAPEAVDAFWRDVDATTVELASTHGAWRRLRARVSPRSLRRKERK